ncbi:urocanate hydratase [Pseudoalteromonas luteoviolacea]|uniref:Urocanate hydratase n=1 Tax=Pseudoalteromonas luteoviolacea H33 TaxID=1365251 RepID=A0A162AL30_9GAMM|nr:urocanate hydratase [Pseudoalteromonas luteoviolacea]KZN51764.1 urocanate hydratase [Pseudoalteromonas luteoviolacea H33]KZN72769.1 urocanate hydratase [Pseudoalteromonas luteoviolacea H33-S]MBQ4880442.1 urocanate hydratase [Pseudoalteromonas luteoviolacea]MBQ4909499.1 urocanate hydratase [Pseudoalteromonas luteoviolacea]
MNFQEQIKQGIPSVLPEAKPYPAGANRAPKRKDILSPEEKQLAVRNALRYFPKEWHNELATEFALELKDFGRIYMYRFKPNYELKARSISDYPAKCEQAAAIMLMIDNNLDPAVAQHPEELITYGGNGAVFQNWAQYLLAMKYLSEMEEDQTLHMYSGHPMGLFPSSKDAPRVVVTNGMMIPNYSQPDDWEKFNALGVTQYGQMTAGSFMYIGPQGIVHGTTITVMNAFRKVLEKGDSPKGKIFLTAGLGGMSGAQPKAGNIANCITVCAEVNPKAAIKRHEQGWVDELVDNMPDLVARVKKAQAGEEVVSIAFIGNIVDVWESFLAEDIFVHLGSDQTSLHNPWSGGYYPVGISYEESNRLIREEPEVFKEKVQATLKRHADAVNKHTAKGTYFFDYGNAFLLESSRAGGDVMAANGIDFKYPSYVQDILGPMCFDYGFGPFRWVCTSGKPEDLDKTDAIAAKVLEEIMAESPEEIQQQMQDNITWIKDAKENKLVVGSQARILYADAEGRIKIAKAFNDAIERGEIGPVVLGRDHHDVSGTDSPFRETSNIYDGSRFTADMAIHNVIGDGFRGATWVSIHNGGGVGWGEVINGGFGMLLDGSSDAERRLESMLLFDVNNGIARRSWARNEEANFAIKREMARTPKLKVTLSNNVDDDILDNLSL